MKCHITCSVDISTDLFSLGVRHERQIGWYIQLIAEKEWCAFTYRTNNNIFVYCKTFWFQPYNAKHALSFLSVWWWPLIDGSNLLYELLKLSKITIPCNVQMDFYTWYCILILVIHNEFHNLRAYQTLNCKLMYNHAKCK